MNTTPVATVQPWYDVRHADPGIFIIEEPHHTERVKSYLIEGEESAMLIDTGMGVGDMGGLVTSLTDKSVFLVNSHAHVDHIGSNNQFEERWIHEAEAEEERLIAGVGNERLRNVLAPELLTGPLPDGFDIETIEFPPSPPTHVMLDGHQFDLGERVLEVLHCPGHSPGGIALLDGANGALFSTDVAYAGLLYVFTPEDLPVYHASLKRLAELESELMTVYPAHDDSPVEPALLSKLAHGIGDVIEGREPNRRESDMALYEFDGFSLLLMGLPEMA